MGFWKGLGVVLIGAALIAVAVIRWTAQPEGCERGDALADGGELVEAEAAYLAVSDEDPGAVCAAEGINDLSERCEAARLDESLPSLVAGEKAHLATLASHPRARCATAAAAVLEKRRCEAALSLKADALTEQRRNKLIAILDANPASECARKALAAEKDPPTPDQPDPRPVCCPTCPTPTCCAEGRCEKA